MTYAVKHYTSMDGTPISVSIHGRDFAGITQGDRAIIFDRDQLAKLCRDIPELIQEMGCNE